MTNSFKSLVSLVLIVATSSSGVAVRAFAAGVEAESISSRDRRGSAADYDAGPPKDSNWPDLFAETPNYRAYGKAIYQAAAKKFDVRDDGQEKFRWIMGPMWYRGRLTPNDVKVFIIGQEGAQDENVSNRSFTGSTGTKLQNFLAAIGIDRSYLFMNTFVYTITGQYGAVPKPTDSEGVKRTKAVQTAALNWLAQDEDSVVVQHRHKMFDEVLRTNKSSVRLVIGVGAAGKDSLATWFNHLKKDSCDRRKLEGDYCEVTVQGVTLTGIGVKHPGGASQSHGGAAQAALIKADFTKKVGMVRGWMKDDANWIKTDVKVDLTAAYHHGDTSVPYRDFAFGTNHRMGKDGTASNRRDGGDAIQVYSDAGEYNFKGVKYDDVKDVGPRPTLAKGDLPWESPKTKEGRRDFDVGPGKFAEVLTAWPDFKKLGVTSSASFGYTGIYRGNLENAQVLVVGDQESNDDMFSGRALTGTGGQRLQTLLESMNLGGKYAILRTLPVDTLDLSQDEALQIAKNDAVAKAREAIINAVLKEGKTKVILALGPVAQEVIKDIDTKAEIVSADNLADAAKQINKLGVAGIKSTGYSDTLTSIPRGDLPAITRVWMGTSGTRSTRAYTTEGGKKVLSPDYYQFSAPDWVDAKNYPAKPTELNADEQAAVAAFVKADITIKGATASNDDSSKANDNRDEEEDSDRN